ncbi:hypothetical protein ANN_06026 [Periplaneta americana]|uniref:RNase H type-1 domain-containing protein n=1 Tax=Periplaneta americana TaxID=6978 RepID=A0ABQ8TCG8_PERAM|nr:hypothetical protein ANN_06026 [Periplaneta americana]
MAGLCEGGNEPPGSLKATRDLGLHHDTVFRILKDNKFHSYHIHLHQELGGHDFQTGVDFCNWFLNTDRDFKLRILWTDEATFKNSRITLVRNQTNHTHLIEEIRREVKEAERKKWLELNWIKAHAGHEGNELADQLAKEAARSEDIPESYSKTPKSAVKDAEPSYLWAPSTGKSKLQLEKKLMAQVILKPGLCPVG